MLVGTYAGRLAEIIREDLALWRLMHSIPEQGSLLFQERCGRILLCSLCESNRVFIDVGAHIGSIVSGVLNENPNAAVVAIEPDPEKSGWLKKKFPSVKVHNCAAGNTETEVDFDIDSERPGYSSVMSSTPQNKSAVRRIRVPMHRLDNLYSGAMAVGLIKIDVEGMELAVLLGATALVARYRPIIYFESAYGGGASFGFSSEELFDCFSQHEYQVFVPNRVAHDGPPLRLDGFLESHYYPQRSTNYLAIPSERRVEIRDRARTILHIEV